MPYDITTKDGITLRNIPDEIPADSPQIRSRIASIRAGSDQPSTKPPVKIGEEGFGDALRSVLQGTNWGTRNIAGAGTALSNLIEGVKQIANHGDKQRIQANRIMAEEAPLGAIAGNLALFAPTAMIPGANTIAGGSAIGAVSGLLQPTTEGESRLQNTGIGALGGAAVPAAIRLGKIGKAALVDPFTEAGRTRIAGGVLNRAAADPAAVASRLPSVTAETPGVSLSVGQAADDAGLASLERTVRAINPQAFDALDKSQRAALADQLRAIAGDPIKRQALVDARESAANSLYGRAMNSDAMRRDLAQQQLASNAQVASGGIHQATPIAAESLAQDLATPGLRELSNRPMFQAAVNEAKTLAANKGVRLDDPLQSLQGLHYIKLALDDMMNPGAASALGRNASAAVMDMRSKLTDELAKISPAYGQARSVFADMSKPINQMDIGQNLLERFIPALYRDMPSPAQLNSAALAKAVTDQGDDIARTVSGMKGATLEGTMSPEQMKAINGVLADTQMMKNAEMQGRGVGSDTVQKMAMSHLAAEAGIPNWMASIARVPGGWMKRAGDVLYGNSDEQVRLMLADLLRNPTEAAAAMNSAGANPSQLAEALKRLSVGAGQAVAPTMLTAQ